MEKYVQFLETHLLEDLKEKVYYSIEDINRDVRQKIADINNGKKTPQSLSKMESFLRYDKPQMKPLVGESFVLCDYKYFARVPNNYHLLYDDHYMCSAPVQNSRVYKSKPADKRVIQG